MPLLIAYSEIALKSKYVRNKLESILATQIENILHKAGYTDAEASRKFGRIIVQRIPPVSAKIASRVFGVAKAMYAEQSSSDIESIIELMVRVAESQICKGQSFAIRPRAIGNLPYHSKDIAVKGGSAILNSLKTRELRVDLNTPDIELFVEARDKDAYIYTEIIPGVLGLPYGSQGKAVALFSGGIDSPAAAWMVMKRGVAVDTLFMDQTPYVGSSYLKRAENAWKEIAKYVPSEGFALHVAQMGIIMERILESKEPKLTCILCKRSMYRIASYYAQQRKAKAIITGESLGQVASQTLDNLIVLEAAASVPVIRPLIALDKVEIEVIAKKIGTYNVTAIRTEGCKAVPKTPATTSRIEGIEALEKELSLKDLCQDAAKGVVRIYPS